MAEYAYDAWGACTILSDTSGRNIAALNPFRYRGYYYDTETGLYYLQSRYYDPTTGRFINADDAAFITINRTGTITQNLFVYCTNSPILSKDDIGCAGFRDVWNAIKSSFNFIKSIAEQAYSATQKMPPIQQIKKLSKQSGKSQRQIIRELTKLANDSSRCMKHFKIAGIVFSVLSVIIFALSYLQAGKKLFSDVYALIVDLFVEAANWLICKIAELACRAIPACGIIIGFAASWAIGMMISAFFTSSRKKRMTNAYTSKIKSSKKWYDWFIQLFYSIAAAF